MNRESLIRTLESATANATDVYFSLYEDYLENGDEPEEALRIILEYPREIGDTEDRNPKSIARQEESRMVYSLESFVSGMTIRIAEMNLPQEDFYRRLYQVFFKGDDDFCPCGKEEKVIALKILSESVWAVPYYQITETTCVNREEIEEGIEAIQKSLQEAFYMLNRPFRTKPERAAQMLRIADAISDKKLQIIYWTVILDHLRNKSERD